MEKLKLGDVIYHKSHHGTLTVARVRSETPKRVKAKFEGGTATIKKQVEKYWFDDSLSFREIGGMYRIWRKVTPEIQKEIEELEIEIPGP
jgi:hypothetical protein